MPQQFGSEFNPNRADGSQFRTRTLLHRRRLLYSSTTQITAFSEERKLPRYFFNVYHESSNVDREGEELPDKHAAWKEATQMAGQILQDIDGNFKPGQTWKLEVHRGVP